MAVAVAKPPDEGIGGIPKLISPGLPSVPSRDFIRVANREREKERKRERVDRVGEERSAHEETLLEILWCDDYLDSLHGVWNNGTS
jgi:hypothetical protein